MKLRSRRVWTALVQAKDFYLEFLERLRSEYVADRVKDGVFGAMMHVSLVNDVSPATMPVALVLCPISSLPKHDTLPGRNWELLEALICRVLLPQLSS